MMETIELFGETLRYVDQLSGRDMLVWEGPTIGVSIYRSLEDAAARWSLSVEGADLFHTTYGHATVAEAAILPSRSLHGLARYGAIWKRFELTGRAAPEWAIRSIKYCKRRPKFAGANGGKDEIIIVAMERLCESGSVLVNPSISWI